MESAADAHDLAYTLHAAAEEPADTAEFLEVPSRNLDNDIVQTWLKASASKLRHRVLDFVQGNAETKLSRNEGKRVSGRFRGESG